MELCVFAPEDCSLPAAYTVRSPQGEELRVCSDHRDRQLDVGWEIVFGPLPDPDGPPDDVMVVGNALYEKYQPKPVTGSFRAMIVTRVETMAGGGLVIVGLGCRHDLLYFALDAVMAKELANSLSNLAEQVEAKG